MIDATHLAEALFSRRSPLKALQVKLLIRPRPGVYWLFQDCSAQTFWQHVTYIGRANQNIQRRLLVQVNEQGDSSLSFTVCYAPSAMRAYRLESWALRVARLLGAPLLNRIQPAGLFQKPC
jgi:hypothetical protein